MNLEQFFKQKNSFYYWLILLSTIVFFSKSLGYDFFVFDDYEYIRNNPRVAEFTLKNILWYWKNANTKTPLFFNFIQVLSSIWGNYNAALFRLVNILFHGSTGFLVFKIVQHVLTQLHQKEKVIKAETITGISLLAAAIFLFHPTQMESVVWIYSMRGVVAGFFGLASILFYFKFIDQHQMKYFYWAIVFFVVGMLFKFSIAAVPLAFIFIDYFFEPEMSIGKSLLRHWLLIAIGISFYFIFKYEFTTEVVESFKATGSDQFFISLRTTTHYLKRLVFPLKYQFDYGLNYDNFKLFLPHPWITRGEVFGLVLINIFTIRSLVMKQKNVFVFCYLLFVVLIFPGLGVIPHDFQYISFVADRYMYLAVFVLVLTLAIIVAKFISTKPEWVKSVGAVYLFFIVFTSFKLMTLWSDSGDLLYRSFQANIESSIAFEGVVTYYDHKGALDKVTTLLFPDTKGMKRHRGSFMKLAQFLGRQKRVHEGEILINDWLNNKINFTDLLYFYLYYEAQIYSKARDQFEHVRKMPKDTLRECGVNLEALQRDLDKLKAEVPLIFSTWIQNTSLNYKGISEELKLFSIERGYVLEK